MSRAFSVLRTSSECHLKSQRRCLNLREGRRRLGNEGVAKVCGVRRYNAAATASVKNSERRGRQQEEYLDDEEIGDSSLHDARYSNSSSTVPYPKSRTRADPEPLIEHLRRLFPPLEFPGTVATQMMTHKTAREAWAGHNARLAFVGRRVLHSYLLLFLQHASQKLARSTTPSIDTDQTFDFDHIAYKALFTHLLGEHVGMQWGLARTMLWTPPVKARRRAPLTGTSPDGGNVVEETLAALKSPGLYKVQGTTVEGIMGGIYHQFGGTIAQRVFHTRLLPHILCPGAPLGLHDAFHPAALEMQARMGGPDGLLVRGSSQRTSNDPRSQPSTLSQAAEQGWNAAYTSSGISQASRNRIAL